MNRKMLLFILLGFVMPVLPLSAQDYGNITFNVAGIVQGEKNGFADFDITSDFIHRFEISMNDRGPQTYSMQFAMMSDAPMSPPEPGTYKIGGGFGDGTFSVIFTDTSEGFANSKEFSSDFSSSSGQIVIDSVSSGEIKGSFAIEISGADGSIQLKNGRFAAIKRIN
ncbi:MAG: hypothetical protein LAT67_08665 [Balneolales bacterium]|nr:hypothetical protein [Balneolales bacterium]